LSERTLPDRLISDDDVAEPGTGLGPTRTILAGNTVQLEPLDPDVHAAELFVASHDSDEARQLWTHLPYGPFVDIEAFTSWLGDRASAADPLFFAVRDQISGRAGGMASFLAIERQHRSVEIGHIWFGPSLQNTTQSTEALYLMMAHTFDDLRYRRLEWKCDAMNAGSRRAALRLGFGFEGIFYQHRIVNARNRDTAWYSLLDYEWPSIKPNFERWLSPHNFDGQGKPRQSLSELNAAVRASSAAT
jgi:RimJ/RimL family protein N-acetyltransferase